MRFPYQAVLRIRPVSPISDNPPTTNIYGQDLRYPCIVNTTSGTFDPDITFNGEDVESGAFGELVDVIISSKNHQLLRNLITSTRTPFSAPLMLRLFAIYRRTLEVAQNGNLNWVNSDINLLDNNETIRSDLPSIGENFIGFPLASMRMFPTVTTLTFTVKRVRL